jgi:hypothetical protein
MLMTKERWPADPQVARLGSVLQEAGAILGRSAGMAGGGVISTPSTPRSRSDRRRTQEAPGLMTLIIPWTPEFSDKSRRCQAR